MRRKITANFWLVVVVILVSFWLREWYPISRFPMYRYHWTETDWIYVTDANNEPVPFRDQFGRTAIRLKKVYKKRLSVAEQDPQDQGLPREELEAIIGEIVLRQTIEERRRKDPLPDYGELKLWMGMARMDEEGAIEKSDRELASIDLSP